MSRPDRQNDYSEAPTCGDLLGTNCRVSVFVGRHWQVLVGIDASETHGSLWPFVGPQTARCPVRYCPGCGAELGYERKPSGKRGGITVTPWARAVPREDA